jgi:hypothetical protein
VTYSNIDALTFDPLFAGRVRSCCVEQAEVFRNDARPDFVALAEDVLRGGGVTVSAFVRFTAAAPGVADQAATVDGIDQTRVADAVILSTVQANWQTVAGLYFDEAGDPLPIT